MSSRGLRKAGIPVMIGHSADNLGDAAVVVCSTAIKDGNPEIEAAAERRLPRVRRAEMLAELMRMQKTIAVAGTHGKTTTTSMIAAMLDAGGLDPTVINGGIINRYGSNARLGKSDWMVVEADESDGSFLRLDGTIAVVTNIDPEHLEHYGSFERGQGRLRRVHRERALLRPRGDVRRSSRSAEHAVSRIRDRRVVTYGFSALADLRADNVAPEPGGTRFDAVVLQRDGVAADDRGHPPADARAGTMCRMRWPRSPSAIELGIDDATIARGLRAVRRGQAPLHPGRRGRRARSSSTIMPIIRSRSARCCRRRAKARRARTEDGSGRVIAVMQPHRYTRLQALMDDFQNAFNDADIVFVAPVYAAGEEPIEGVDSAALGRRAARPRPPHGQAGRAITNELAESLRDIAAEGDMIICMGAGDITKWAAGLADGILQGEEVEVSAVATMPKVRGKLTPDAPLAPLVWFKSGGEARMAVRAGRRRRSGRLPRASSIPTCR